ncbi:MAG: (d)CMP kinase [Planctomycetes bacterium]|nr:(d)CMP kinase [Planctomycetota bacterium]
MKPRRIVLTIDGPGGAGKSTVARRLAERLGFAFLDSGAVYRAATWFVARLGLDWEDEAPILAALDDFHLRLEESRSGMKVFVNSIDVTVPIRLREVSNHVFHLARRPGVREKLVPLQRSFAEGRNIVAEGRDMGSVVFPDADLKVYLDASLEERARRRKKEHDARGEEVSLEVLQAEIQRRDHRDMMRTASPLSKPEGAFVLDATLLQVDQVLEILVQEAKRRKLV